MRLSRPSRIPCLRRRQAAAAGCGAVAPDAAAAALIRQPGITGRIGSSEAGGCSFHGLTDTDPTALPPPTAPSHDQWASPVALHRLVLLRKCQQHTVAFFEDVATLLVQMALLERYSAASIQLANSTPTGACKQRSHTRIALLVLLPRGSISSDLDRFIHSNLLDAALILCLGGLRHP